MKERIKDADYKLCNKVLERSPVKIGFALGALANTPLLIIVFGGFGA